MSAELESRSVVSAERRRYPKIDACFDTTIHIVKRIKELADECKGLITVLLILLLLIEHSYHVLMK